MLQTNIKSSKKLPVCSTKLKLIYSICAMVAIQKQVKRLHNPFISFSTETKLCRKEELRL